MLSRVYDAIDGDEGLAALVEALRDGVFGAQLRGLLGVTEKEHDASRRGVYPASASPPDVTRWQANLLMNGPHRGKPV